MKYLLKIMQRNFNDHTLLPAMCNVEECFVNNTKGIKILNNMDGGIYVGGYCSVMNSFTLKHL